MYLSPSNIHYLSTTTTNIIPTTPDHQILDLSRKFLANCDFPKIQVVEKDGHWFTLNNSQLEIFKRLELDGKCKDVKVDVVPLSGVPKDIRQLMVFPPILCADDKNQTASESNSRETDPGYKRLEQSEGKELHDLSTPQDSETTDNSESDSDSECDWSQDDRDSSECDSSAEEEKKSSDDERECLL